MNNTSIVNWTFKNGSQKIDCTSFPYAYRTMFNVVRKSIVDKKPVNTRDLSIMGPKDSRGDRRTYTYESATELAEEMELLKDGQINSKEFKKH